MRNWGFVEWFAIALALFVGALAWHLVMAIERPTTSDRILAACKQAREACLYETQLPACLKQEQVEGRSFQSWDDPGVCGDIWESCIVAGGVR